MSSIAKEKMRKYNLYLQRLLKVKSCRLADGISRNAYSPYHYDNQRWSGLDAWRNMAKHQAAQRFGFPLKFNVEVTTQCVFKCEFCVLHSNRLSRMRKQNYLNTDNFSLLLRQIKPFVTHIEFTGGEPLLNQSLHEMIALCNAACVKTTVATNAKLLQDKNIKSLLDAPPSILLVAYETGNHDAYGKQRSGGDLDQLEYNVKALLRERLNRGITYPRIHLQTVVSRETAPYIETFWANAEKLGVDAACYKPIFAWPDGDEAYWKIMKDKYLILNHPLSYYQSNEKGEIKETRIKGFCPNVGNVHIGADGSVIPCWYNLLTSPSLGNVMNTNFVDIWFSDKYEIFRSQMREHTAYEHGCRYCIGIYQPHLFKSIILKKANG